ncbi:50S ribosomal protein L19e [Candidatus Woesearchaeota archaeon]|nr:50S ribosomal protein L19e [Candidatus Woesearchaeota archaeon]
MRLHSQKRLAAELLGVGKSRVWIDNSRLDEAKEAITKEDIRGLIKKNIIQAKPKIGISRSRAKKINIQKRKGRRQGAGSRKGSRYARLSSKEMWINKVRAQRNFLSKLKVRKLLENKDYRKIYGMVKGNAFRSVRHIKLYLTESNIVKGAKKDPGKSKVKE